MTDLLTFATSYARFPNRACHRLDVGPVAPCLITRVRRGLLNGLVAFQTTTADWHYVDPDAARLIPVEPMIN